MTDLYSRAPEGFGWATGIENTFIPQGRPGLRPLEEYELTQHYQQWRSDFDLVAETGVRAVRWGIPWYRVQPTPRRWDWRWIDRSLDYLVNVKRVAPILDLMHYGTPLWLEGSFSHPDYPKRVAEYAAAVAARYHSLVRYYTPLNEPMVNADRCGRRGDWPPYLRGDAGYVKLTLALARGIVLTTQVLKAEQPDALTVQVEALWHTWTQEEALQTRVAQDNARQFLCFDLTTGRVDAEYVLSDYLRRHGAGDADLDWFRRNAVTFDIFGANFYPWSYGELKARPDGSLRYASARTDGATLAVVVRDAYARYQMPIAVTETSARRAVPGRGRWMDETIAAVRELREAAIPVVGYTWFPLFTMIDWSYRRGRRPLQEYLLHLGLYDSTFDLKGVLRRHRTPLVERYQDHMAVPMAPIGDSV